jgi:hypothetical protein
MNRAIISVLAVLALVGPAQAGDTPDITGFADASYFHDLNAGQGEFGLDQVEVDIVHQASDATMVRADLEWVKDGEDFVAQVEQAFMSYTCPGGYTLTFGKFNAPIGFELLDAPDMYQFSHALVFDHGLPTNLTGFMVGRDLSDVLDLVLYGANGWDANTASGKNLTWGGRLGFAPGQGLAGGLSAISGKEENPLGSLFTRTVIDVDLGYESGPWVFGGEFNSGKVTLPDDSELTWTGFLVMSHYTVNDWAGLTVRFDHFDDADGYAFGMVGDQYQARQALTIAPTFTLDDGFGALVELRMDMSDQEAFLDSDGLATDSQTTLAFEMTYSW